MNIRFFFFFLGVNLKKTLNDIKGKKGIYLFECRLST